MRIIDLFAGAGGFSLGAELAGGHIEHAIEVDGWATESLRFNHPGTRVTQADIRQLDDDWIRKEITPHPDLIIGGPPCQGFSRAGPVDKDPKDPRNSLFREFVRFTAALEPSAIILENVPGILKAKMANGDSVINVIQEELRAIGYQTQVIELQAERYGVPQIRRRVFVVGFSKSDAFLVPETHGNEQTIFTNQLKPVLTLRDAISDLPNVDVGDRDEPILYSGHPINEYQGEMRLGASEMLYNHVPMRHSARLIERFRHIPPGGSQSGVPSEHAPIRRVRTAEQGSGSYDQNNRRMHFDKPCHTLAASFYANFLHPVLNRNFTVREGARIQSFPDHYRFFGKPTVVSQKLLAREGRSGEQHLCQYNQVGNAVPPKLAQAVIGAALTRLSSTSVRIKQ